MATPRPTAPATPVLAVSCRMLRSPSHESVTTDLSLFSVSSLASEAFGGKHRISGIFREQRGPSPNPETKLSFNRPADIPEITWFEEGNDLIRSCAVLSSALGMQKSFSTSDITQLPLLTDSQTNNLRLTVSELALNSLQRCGYLLDHPRLDQTSRSCSTWVAVGELASTSQLPSPHGGPANPLMAASTPPPPAFTAADLIRSVNKKVRQNYIRRRLLTTYRALERLSQSEFNLDRLEAAAVAASTINGPGPTELVVPTNIQMKSTCGASGSGDGATADLNLNSINKNDSCSLPSNATTTETKSLQSTGAQPKNSGEMQTAKQVPKQAIIYDQLKKISINVSKNLTVHDIERERGKPLSKYERNMMIFNWLHSLDETSNTEDMP